MSNKVLIDFPKQWKKTNEKGKNCCLSYSLYIYIYICARNGVLHNFFGECGNHDWISKTIKLDTLRTDQGDLLSEILAKESAAQAAISRSGLLQLGTTTPWMAYTCIYQMFHHEKHKMLALPNENFAIASACEAAQMDAAERRRQRRT